ncbi:MAG: hypothetical protein IT378_01740 [Sandaracinaceae bacterium]|nr:hypothetical protein [Sandaracinaceae bacterium]
MKKKVSLTKAPAREGLGLPTIMDRDLATQHGVRYVHLAAFAIDVDRVREAVEGYGDPRPFAWEVFLTERYLLARFDPREDRALVEDAVLSILDGEPDALGAQLAFALWDAIARGRWPSSSKQAFASWKGRPDEMVRDLAPLWRDEAAHARSLAAGCLDVELDPPLAPPTRAALEAMAARSETP